MSIWIKAKGSDPVEEEEGDFDGPAELPRATVDTTLPAVNGTTTTLTGSSGTTALQTAIDAHAARDGNLTHEIVLDAGSTWTGNYTCPVKSGSNPTGTGQIIIRSAGSLPAVGTRILPADAAQAAIIRPGDSLRALTVNTGAHHYHFVGINFTVPGGTTTLTNDLVRVGTLGAAQDTLAEIPHHIIFERCLFRGHATLQAARALALNCDSGAVVQCYFDEWHSTVGDSQCIWVTNCYGPILCEDNYMSCSGEIFFLGGDDPAITDMLPSDVTVRGCHFWKDPAWVGSAWLTYNHFELKLGVRVLIENCVFQHCWVDAHQGMCFNFKSENQISAPWSRAADVTVRFCIVEKCGTLATIEENRDLEATDAARFSIHDILAFDIGDFGGVTASAQAVAVTDGVDGCQFERITLVNTTARFFHLEWASKALNLAPYMGGFVYRNNLNVLNSNGLTTRDGGSGKAGLDVYCNVPYIFAGNYLIGTTAVTYPAGNTIGSTLAAIFTDPTNDDYSLKGGSPALTSGVGGTYSGADVAAVLAATAGVV